MTVLENDISSNHHAYCAEFDKRGYVNNGWDRLKRWDGRASSLVDAGISGPSRVEDSWTPTPSTAAGDCSVGLHVVRYRYKESSTGQVSDPSEEREITIATGAEQITFAIDTSGAGNIIRSSDSKVDRIVLEMTTVNGDVFYAAAEVPMSDTTIVVDVPDAELELLELDYDDTGHSVPPVAKFLLSHKDRLWLFGQVTHAIGNCDVTNGSPNVDAGAIDPDWRTSALGASSGASTAGTWLLQIDGDTRVYEVDYYDEGNTRLILKENYAGTSDTDVSYKLFNRVDAIWVSTPSFPESFSPLKFLKGPNGEGAGELTAGLGWGNSVLFFTPHSMFRLTWDEGPLVDPLVMPLSNKYGALDQRVVIEVEGTIYTMDRNGWVAWEGLFPKFISREIEPIREQINFDYADRFHCTWFPNLRAIRWHVCYTGEVYPKHYVQYDVDTKTWSTGSFLHGISDSRLVPTAEGPVVYYGDTAGHTWLADRGYCDGCAEEFGHLTVGGGASTTSIPVNEILSSVGVGLAGCYAYWVEGEQYRLITASSVGGLTVAPGFSSAPADGDHLWIGPYTSRLKTRAFKPRKKRNKMRTKHAWVEFTPLDDTRYLIVRVYEDRSTQAKGWAQLSRNNLKATLFPGTTTGYDEFSWLIDLSEEDGLANINIWSEFKRYFELELEIFEPAALEVLGIEVDGDVTGEDDS